MLNPDSLNVAYTDFRIFQLFFLNSSRYCAKKRSVSSTESPNAIPKTKIVEGFNGMSKKPIIPAVNNNGNKFGIIETKTILNERNMKATKSAVKKKAKINEESRLSKR